MRGIEKAVCSCGGQVEVVEPTDEENKQYNCMRGCCLTVFECKGCKKRFCVREEAPDAW